MSSSLKGTRAWQLSLVISRIGIVTLHIFLNEISFLNASTFVLFFNPQEKHILEGVKKVIVYNLILIVVYLKMMDKLYQCSFCRRQLEFELSQLFISVQRAL